MLSFVDFKKILELPMKRFRNTYIVGSVVVAIFVVLAEIAVQWGFTASSEDERLINVASRQKVLVERIAKSALILLQTANPDTFQLYKKQLVESLELWEKSHQALLKGDVLLGIKTPKNSVTTIQKFQEIQPYFEKIQNAAISIASNDYSLVVSDPMKKQEIQNNLRILLENESQFSSIMEEIIQQYIVGAEGRSRTTALIAWIVGGVILLVLLLMVLFYFNPVSQKLEEFVEELERKNKKLSQSEFELRKISEEQIKLNEELFLARKQLEEQNEKLKQAEEEARKALERQERTNQKLLVAQRELQKTLVEQNRINQQLLEVQHEAERKAQELIRTEAEMRQIIEAQLEASENLIIAQNQAERAKQQLAITVQKQEALNRILQKSILTSDNNFNEFLEYTIDVLSEIRFLELLPGVGIFLKKENESEVYEMVRQKNINPKIQELCHNIRSGNCLCGLAIKTKETQYAHCIDERHTTRFEGIKEHGHYNVPILYQNQALGALVVYLPHGHKREQSEIDFLEAVTNIIASTYVKVKNEQEIKTVTERLNLAIDGSNDGIWDWDINNNKVYFSPRWKEMLGYKDEELENSFDTFVSLQHPEDTSRVSELLNKYLQGETDVYEVEFRMKCKDGSYKWILSRGVALRDEQGNPYRMAGSHTDIDKRKKAEEELRKAEQEMRLLAETQLETNEKLLLAQKEIEKSKKELEETLENQKLIINSLALAQKELNRRTEELEKAEREMRLLAEAQLEANEKLLLSQKAEKERLAKIEKYNSVLTQLSTTPYEKYGSLEKAFQNITEKTAEALGIERVSIWNYTGTSIILQDLFEQSKNQHSSGMELFEKDFPKYFEGIKSEKAVVAFDAHTHPYTFEFSEVYLKPLNINSMLDTPIWVAGNLKGVICCEYVGKDFKKWTVEDENFVRSITEIISLTIEADKRLKAEEELKLAFENLKNSQKEIERLSLVAAKTENLVLLMNKEGVVEWINASFEKTTEYTFEEIKGKTFDYLLRLQGVNEVDIFEIQQQISVLKKSITFEIKIISKSQKEYWINFNITPLLEEECLSGFIVVGSDITRRKQAELELQKALEKARRAEEDMRALAEAQLEANEKLMIAERQLKESLENEKKQKEELDRLLAKLKETQGQLVHNEKMASLGQLTAGIAHEINNPINFVYNGIDTLKISLDDLMEIVNKYNELDNANGDKDRIIQEAKQLKEQLGFEELTQDIESLVSDIKKGAIRTMEIVKGLRIFSRLDEEERKMASIKECLESTLILLNNKLKGRITVKKYYDETMPDILCYPGQLNQVFMNILNNAIQAIPEDRKDGEITIYTENQEENVIIRIKDNGIGMSEQVKKRIFEPFFTTKPVGVGTGLGLSITFGIIEKHKGQIFVNSEEGKGTEFVIQLPKERV